jgi:hypothetical protein
MQSCLPARRAAPSKQQRKACSIAPRRSLGGLNKYNQTETVHESRGLSTRGTSRIQHRVRSTAFSLSHMQVHKQG